MWYIAINGGYMNKIFEIHSKFMIRNGYINESELETYQYGLEVIKIQLLIAVIVLLEGWYFRCILETLVFICGFASVRWCAGGYHATSKIKCYILTIGLYNMFLILLFIIPENIDDGFIYLSLVISSLILFKWAPFVNTKKQLNSSDLIRQKKLSHIICLLDWSIVIISKSIIKWKIYSFAYMIGVLVAIGALFVAYCKKEIYS